MTWEIRPMRQQDQPFVVQMCGAHARFERAPQPCCTVADLDAASGGTEPRLWVWVLAAPEIRGFMSVTEDFSTWSGRFFVHLDCLYLEPNARGGGWGRRMMEILQGHARARGHREIQWQTPAWNRAAIAFYARLGAKSLDKRRFSLEVCR